MTDKLNLLKKEKRAVDSFISFLTTGFADNMERIILFGSKARGTRSKNSDIDILIVLRERNRGVIDKIYQFMTDILLSTGLDISTKIYSLEEFNRLWKLETPFFFNIKKDGINLWSRS